MRIIILSLGYLFSLMDRFKNKYYKYKLISNLGNCGTNFGIGDGFNIVGANNIYVGNNVSIGSNVTLFSTQAKLIIGNYVVFGPNVTIITGDHHYSPGKYMLEIKENEKPETCDKDVVIEEDVWIGCNTIILKGVTIRKGSIIGAGAVVTKDIPEYSIFGGNPARFIKNKWNKEEIAQHEKIVYRNFK